MGIRWARPVLAALLCWAESGHAADAAATPSNAAAVSASTPDADSGSSSPAPLPPADETLQPGHRGTFSFGYQYQDTRGLVANDGSIRGATTTDTHVAFVDIDYWLADRWEAHLSIPFITKRSNGGPGAHRLDILTVPHPEATFLDDGAFHSAWQDWGVGLSYHAAWRGFEVEPHVFATIPSHDYSHFGNAAIGQNLWKLKLGVELLRRVEHTNFWWSVDYGYEIWERVLGHNLNKHHVMVSAGYFLSPTWAVRGFASARGGLGRNTDDFPIDSRTTEEWYQHDRTEQHTYGIAGLELGYDLGGGWSTSVTAAKMVYGRNIHDLRYAYSVELTRAF